MGDGLLERLTVICTKCEKEGITTEVAILFHVEGNMFRFDKTSANLCDICLACSERVVTVCVNCHGDMKVVRR